jgi:hypothetical protein
MTYRNLSIQELKTNYSDRHGFVFTSGGQSQRVSCEKLCFQIKEKDICKYEPDFINEITPTTYAFVYPEGVSFDSGDFFRYSQQASGMMMGMFQIDMLSAFLKEH